jgi:hypothetical protein
VPTSQINRLHQNKKRVQAMARVVATEMITLNLNFLTSLSLKELSVILLRELIRTQRQNTLPWCEMSISTSATSFWNYRTIIMPWDMVCMWFKNSGLKNKSQSRLTLPSKCTWLKLTACLKCQKRPKIVLIKQRLQLKNTMRRNSPVKDN